MAAELDRLNASVAALKDSVDKLLALPAPDPGVNPADLVPVADAVDAIKASVDAKLPAEPPVV